MIACTRTQSAAHYVPVTDVELPHPKHCSMTACTRTRTRTQSAARYVPATDAEPPHPLAPRVLHVMSQRLTSRLNQRPHASRASCRVPVTDVVLNLLVLRSSGQMHSPPHTLCPTDRCIAQPSYAAFQRLKNGQLTTSSVVLAAVDTPVHVVGTRSSTCRITVTNAFP